MFDGVTVDTNVNKVENSQAENVGNQDAQKSGEQTVDPGKVNSQEAVENDRHPLEPGGERFNQVWARAKQAEALALERERELAREREEKIRLEERLKAKEELAQATKPAEREYSWQELQSLIDNQQATIAQIADYREKKMAAKMASIKQDAVKEAIGQVEQFITAATKQVSVRNELTRYANAIPDAIKPGSEAATRVSQKYQQLLQRGYPASAETELTACELAFGDINTVENARRMNTTPGRDTFQDTARPGGTTAPTKRLVDKLDQRGKQHYERLMARGIYKNWDEVEEELKWEKPR